MSLYRWNGKTGVMCGRPLAGLIKQDTGVAESFFTKAGATCAKSTAACAVATAELKRLRK